MRLLAALASGLAVAVLVGVVTGTIKWIPCRRRRAERVQRQWFAQAGVDVSRRQFWLVSTGVGGVTFFLLYLLTGLWPISLAPAIVVAFLPRAYYSRVRARRLAETRTAWPDGLRDLIASISAGMSLPRALETLTVSGPEPLRRVFEDYQVLARTTGVVSALETIKEDLADPVSDRIIEVLILAHERGGAIVPAILSDLAEAAARDLWALEEIEGEMLEQKINSRVVFVLPWIVLVAMTLRPGPFRDFYASPAGALVVALGATLSLAGLTIAARLGREPEEPRVLVGGEVGRGS